MDFLVTAASGTEAALAAELDSLGLASTEHRAGRIVEGGSLESYYRVVLESRIASRAVVLFGEVPNVTHPDHVYESLRAVDWSEHLGTNDSFAIDVIQSGIAREHHGRFITQRAKDGLVDRMRAEFGSRPNVERDDCDVRVHARWSDDGLLLGVDPFGPLYKRGYRPAGAAAPLRENLAAALLRIAGYTGAEPLVDPMCGSGTLLVEAAMMRAGIAPGLGRRLTRWRGHDASLWKRLHAESKSRIQTFENQPIWGFDIDAGAVDMARESLAKAGIRGAKVVEGALEALKAPTEEHGILIVNPPYGERLTAHMRWADAHTADAELLRTYSLFGDVLKRQFGGWKAHLLTGNPALLRQVGLKPSRKHVLFNGPIECRFASFEVRAAMGADGPGWRKASPESEAFVNRLDKNLQKLKRVNTPLRVFRVYDADVPEFNVAIDVYSTDERGDVAVLQEYRRPANIAEHLAERRMRDIMLIVPEKLGIAQTDLFLRTRQRQEEGGQYEKRSTTGQRYTVAEGDAKILVNFTDYLDTGYFPDHRLVRERMIDLSEKKSFLNLFAYTCVGSLRTALEAGARTTSVDLSQTYLDWGKDNFALNGLRPEAHRFIRSDAAKFLSDAKRAREQWDVIFLNPPSYSRSKSNTADFSIERDHVALLKDVHPLLTTDGVLIFTTHARNFVLDRSIAERFEVTEKPDFVPADFERSPFHAFELRPL